MAEKLGMVKENSDKYFWKKKTVQEYIENRLTDMWLHTVPKMCTAVSENS
jgi:hypothetical protein